MSEYVALEVVVPLCYNVGKAQQSSEEQADTLQVLVLTAESVVLAEVDPSF